MSALAAEQTVYLCLDGWEDHKGQEVFGCTIHRLSGGEPILFKANQLKDRENANVIAAWLTDAVKEIQSTGCKVAGCVADNAGVQGLLHGIQKVLNAMSRMRWMTLWPPT